MTIRTSATTSQTPGSITTPWNLIRTRKRSFHPANVTVQAVPTIFYTRKKSKLAELVDVYIRHNSPSKGGQAVLTLGKEKYTAKLIPDWDFGEQMVEFAVPEFAAGHQG